MELKELDDLKNYCSEDNLIKAVQEIDDKVIYKAYNKEQILCLINELIAIDLLCVKYETREEVLNLLCDIISYYGISNKGSWEKIIDIKDELEDDLKEYVAEFMESV